MILLYTKFFRWSPRKSWILFHGQLCCVFKANIANTWKVLTWIIPSSPWWTSTSRWLSWDSCLKAIDNVCSMRVIQFMCWKACLNTTGHGISMMSDSWRSIYLDHRHLLPSRIPILAKPSFHTGETSLTINHRVCNQRTYFWSLYKILDS